MQARRQGRALGSSAPPDDSKLTIKSKNLTSFFRKTALHTAVWLLVNIIFHTLGAKVTSAKQISQ